MVGVDASRDGSRLYRERSEGKFLAIFVPVLTRTFYNSDRERRKTFGILSFRSNRIPSNSHFSYGIAGGVFRTLILFCRAAKNLDFTNKSDSNLPKSFAAKNTQIDWFVLPRSQKVWNLRTNKLQIKWRAAKTWNLPAKATQFDCIL
jgi:hypothetical protein